LRRHRQSLPQHALGRRRPLGAEVDAAEIEIGIDVARLLRDHLLEMADRLAAAADTGQRLAERVTRARIARRRRHNHFEERNATCGIAILDQQDCQQQAGIVVLAAARQNPFAGRACGRTIAAAVVADSVRHGRRARHSSCPPLLLACPNMPGSQWGGSANEYLSDAAQGGPFLPGAGNVPSDPVASIRPPGMTPRPIIIDTDPGLDDAVAILLAFASPELEVLGLTAVAG